MATNKPIFKKIDMTRAMSEAEKGKQTHYETYRFSGGNSETYADKVGGKPRFVGRR